MDRFKLRIFQVDSYLIKPYHVDRILLGKKFNRFDDKQQTRNVKNVTVIRLFGSTPDGIKTCLHVHRYFSHLSIRKADLLEMYKLESAEDETLMELFREDFHTQFKNHHPSDHDAEESLLKSIEPYSSRCMYGFHENEETFYKIRFYSHFVCFKAKQFLESGLFMGHLLLPYNCLELLLQFYIDNQIFLNTIELNKVTLRRTDPFRDDYHTQQNDDLFKTITTQKMRALPFFPFFNDHDPTSLCFLEGDVSVDNFVTVNCDRIFSNDLPFTPQSPGVINMWNEQFERNNINGTYTEIIKTLSTNIERDSIQSDFNLQAGIMYSFLRNNPLLRAEPSGKIVDKIPQLDGTDDVEEELVVAKPTKCFGKQNVSINLTKMSVHFLLKSQFVHLSPKLRAKISQSQSPDLEVSKLPGDSIYSFYDVCMQRSSTPLLSDQALVVSPLVSSQPKRLRHLHSTPISSRKNLLGQLSENVSSPQDQPSKGLNPKLSFTATQTSSPLAPRAPGLLNSLVSFEEESEGDSCVVLNATQSMAELVWRKCAALTQMSLEVLVNTRLDLVPDPMFDNVEAVCFSIYNEYLQDEFVVENDQQFEYLGAIIVSPGQANKSERMLYADNKVIHIDYVAREFDLFYRLAYLVNNFDPDILIGWTVDTLSWGFLLQRAKALDLEIFKLEMSRINKPYFARDNFEGAKDKCPKLVGRIVINVWNTLRHELALKSYTYESVLYHLFKARTPTYSHQYLRNMWAKSSTNEIARHTVLDYVMGRVTGTIKILLHLDFIRQTFDLSCLFGMKFEDVLTRGTQYRVESMLYPLARKANVLPVRFPAHMVALMASPQHIPLNIEPVVSLYNEPVAVLDFQSLYPSIMIAHNYCFTTCLGRVRNIVNFRSMLGCYRFDERRDLSVTKLKPGDVHVSPNGVAFVKHNMRKGVLSALLEDLLFTRILIKAEMKRVNKAEQVKGMSRKQRLALKTLQRKLNTCQLGLKLIANVTYGYTSANFSGRMPCVEIADSIVCKGRDILERSIEWVNHWGHQSGTDAKVIYGDTDSMFVSFPKSTRAEAFEHSSVLINEINRRHTHPIAIKLEKMYQPCMLFAKKRYCGYAYESSNQATPLFDAKGIETVRRDTCDIVSNVLEQSLRILFENQGRVETLKPYIQWQIGKILNGKISKLSDFVFAKEFSGLNYYRDGVVIPAWRIANRRVTKDLRDEPKHNERVPYVFIDAGDEKTRNNKKPRLADLARDPSELLMDNKLCLNASYYIEKAIFPPLERVLQAINGSKHRPWVQLNAWLAEVRLSMNKKPSKLVMGRRRQLMAWFKQSTCPVCHVTMSASLALCPQCQASSHTTISLLASQLAKIGHKVEMVKEKCFKCCGGMSLAQLKCFDSNESRAHVCNSKECVNIYRYYQCVESLGEMTRLYALISPNLSHEH